MCRIQLMLKGKISLFRNFAVRLKHTVCCDTVQRSYCLHSHLVLYDNSLQAKQNNRNHALDYFDQTYSLLYGEKWVSIREALLTRNRCVALVNNYADSTISEELERSGAVNLKSLIEIDHPTDDDRIKYTKNDKSNELIASMTDWLTTSKSNYFKYFQNAPDFLINSMPDDEFLYPSNLLIYSYHRCNDMRFIRPTTSKNNRLSHFIMNGASIFPPLMLNVQPNDRIYDACSSPGGKSILLLQTLLPFSIVCNDINPVRTHKVKTAFNQFLINYQDDWKNKKIFLRSEDARNCNEYGLYDKILVDVPCSTDRHALKKFATCNKFLSTRINELLTLPELQTDILSNCIRLLKPGGSLVYSTCTLSPIQNDGVVHMGVEKARLEYNVTATVKDLSNTIRPFSKLFSFHASDELRYGQLVLPLLPNNFGPLYFSKITRNIVN